MQQLFSRDGPWPTLWRTVCFRLSSAWQVAMRSARCSLASQEAHADGGARDCEQQVTCQGAKKNAFLGAEVSSLLRPECWSRGSAWNLAVCTSVEGKERVRDDTPSGHQEVGRTHNGLAAPEAQRVGRAHQGAKACNIPFP